MEEFQYTKNMLAHPGKRWQGQFIDAFITVLIFALCLYISKLFGLDGTAVDIAIVLLPAIYFVFSDALPKGQSIGKKILNMSVVSKSTGKPCNILQSAARNIFTPILGIIDAVLIFGNNRQRLGDIFANTIVVKNS